MAAAFNFYAGSLSINDMAGSGLGFYGSGGFGSSVSVGGWNGRTYITNSVGTVQGPEACNVQPLLSASVVVPSGAILGQASSGIPCRAIPNYLASVNIRFTADSAVRLLNSSVRIYDRISVNNPASGVTTGLYECIHPDTVQNVNGSGATTWSFVNSTGSPALSLTSSPGTSGLSPSGANTRDSRHDFYLCLAASPDSFGSKNAYALFVSTEYL